MVWSNHASLVLGPFLDSRVRHAVCGGSVAIRPTRYFGGRLVKIVIDIDAEHIRSEDYVDAMISDIRRALHEDASYISIARTP